MSSVRCRRRFSHNQPPSEKEYLFFGIIPLSRVGARRIEEREDHSGWNRRGTIQTIPGEWVKLGVFFL
jgi:hypothetical protein